MLSLSLSQSPQPYPNVLSTTQLSNNMAGPLIQHQEFKAVPNIARPTIPAIVMPPIAPPDRELLPFEDCGLVLRGPPATSTNMSALRARAMFSIKLTAENCTHRE